MVVSLLGAGSELDKLEFLLHLTVSEPEFEGEKILIFVIEATLDLIWRRDRIG